MNKEYVRCPECVCIMAPQNNQCSCCGEETDSELESITDDELLEYAIELLENAVMNLDASLYPTGYETDPSDNDNMYEKEYWVNGLIDSKYLDVSLGGWFTVDLRDDKPSISFLLVLKIEDKLIGECEGLQGWYDSNSKTWEIVWDSY